MCLTASVVVLGFGKFITGLVFTVSKPEIFSKVVKFALCLAMGQSLIFFYTIANYDPLILSTVTTTRKIFFVLLSIFLNGHALISTGWGSLNWPMEVFFRKFCANDVYFDW